MALPGEQEQEELKQVSLNTDMMTGCRASVITLAVSSVLGGIGIIAFKEVGPITGGLFCTSAMFGSLVSLAGANYAFKDTALYKRLFENPLENKNG